MNLTTEEQRALTEFLGETYEKYQCTVNGLGYYDDLCVYEDPSFSDNPHGSCDEAHKVTNKNDCEHWRIAPVAEQLDFDDWRVVGRLIEKAGFCYITKTSGGAWVCIVKHFTHLNNHSTPAEAVCRAVLAKIAGKE